MKNNKIPGIGREAPTVTHNNGGKQSQTPYAFDCLDPVAMFAMCKTLEEGRKKYGRDNWRKIKIRSHLNHMIIHAFAYLAGDTQDEHLEHMAVRAHMALAVALAEQEVKTTNDFRNRSLKHY